MLATFYNSASCTCTANTNGSPSQFVSIPTLPSADVTTHDADADVAPAPLSGELVDAYEPAPTSLFDSSVTSLEQEMEEINPDDLLNLE